MDDEIDFFGVQNIPTVGLSFAEEDSIPFLSDSEDTLPYEHKYLEETKQSTQFNPAFLMGTPEDYIAPKEDIDPPSFLTFLQNFPEEDETPDELSTAPNSKKRPRSYIPSTTEGIVKKPSPTQSKEEQEAADYFISTIGTHDSKVVPASPEKIYGDHQLYKTDQGTKVRALVVITDQSGDGQAKHQYGFFKKLTPLKTKKQIKGQTQDAPGYQIECSANEGIAKRLAFPLPPKNVSFTVTQQTIEEAGQQERGSTQLQLMGYTARQVFLMYADDPNVIGENGRDYHWAHIIAFGLGGKQDKNNLVPNTEKANHMTQYLVENKIKKLLREATDSVHIEVTLEYKSDYLGIPDMINYTLKWQDKRTKKIHHATCPINPRSLTPYCEELKNLIDELISINLQSTTLDCEELKTLVGSFICKQNELLGEQVEQLCQQSVSP